jgi:protein gp37
MAENTNISCADATFNPWIGCTKVSPACDNCYAQTLVEGRFKIVQWGADEPRVRTSAANWRKPLAWNRLAKIRRTAWQHGIDLHGGDEAACIAAGFIKPTRPRVFCASLADVFDNEVDPQWRVDLFELIAKTPHLDWLLLTKRIGNANQMLDDAIDALSNGINRWRDAPWPNIWLGITVCNQAEADRDVPKLLAVPAAKRFLSIEPMLGAIDLKMLHPATPISPGLDWVICGGESAPNARPLHPSWAGGLRDQCNAAGVPFNFKQWGEWCPQSVAQTDKGAANAIFLDKTGTQRRADFGTNKGAVVMQKVGTKVAGRQLEGREWNEVPN